jgi:hypothetical protein
MPDYLTDLLIIFAVLFPIYLITYILHLKGIIKRKPFYRMWNVPLAVIFILAVITSILSLLNVINKFWHVEFAFIMLAIIIFHIHLYWRQFKRGF